MNADDNREMAEQLAGVGGEWYSAQRDWIPSILARAQVHATLAVADELRKLGPWIKEIGDQLDTMPRTPAPPVVLDIIRCEILTCRDLTTRARLRLALAMLIADKQRADQMASTGTIADTEPT